MTYTELTSKIARAELIGHLLNSLPSKTETICKSKLSKRKMWIAYKNKAWDITLDQPLSDLDNSEKRGFDDYHLDHKISVWYGFKNSIPPERIGHISNLRFIPHKENTDKHTDCIVGNLKFK